MLDNHGIGLGNRLIVPLERPPGVDAPIETTERLGGLHGLFDL